jgi:hypothetical protein
MIEFPKSMHRLSIYLLAAAAAWGTVPTPKEHLGFTPGDDYKLADWAQISGYFQKLAAASDRIRLVEFGRTALGKPMYVAFLSSPENLKRLDRWREINRRLALGQASAEEARTLAAEGKAIVWIDSGLHASEVAPVQHAPELTYRMLTAEDEETRSIRENVVLMQIPCINPDGLDWVAHWYRDNVGTVYETAPLPRLYHKYAGHDNNRDWFMLNLVETRHVSRLLFREWFPHIVYNQHQAPPFPARIFVPPYGEPLNPHIPAPVMEGINVIGSSMKERFARENKSGVLSYQGFDAWWNGGLRSSPAFHNMHGILTETAGHQYATPRVYKKEEIRSHFANGIPSREPSIFYQRPWLGGKWGVRDAIEYMLTADWAILSHAAVNRRDYLLKAWLMAHASMEAKDGPYAYVISTEQHDFPTALEMLDRLWQAGIEVRRATAAFQAGETTYPAGTFVLLAGQAFRPYLMDLMEPQKYPEIRGTGGATKRPYDIAGWTLRMQMGVAVDRIEKPFEAQLETVTEFRAPGAVRGSGPALHLDHRENNSFLATAGLLERGARIEWTASGEILLANAGNAEEIARAYGVTVTRRDGPAGPAAFEIRKPRVALYQPWQANMDQGWTEWLLDRYRVPYTIIHNEDFRKGDLGGRFDTVLLASQSAASILHGARHGEIGAARDTEAEVVATQRPEYRGGIGVEGLGALQKFVSGGGRLVALDAATELAIQFFPLSARNVARGGQGESSSFYCPGSLLRFQADTAHPLAFGMPQELIGFSSGGAAFEITLGKDYNKGEQEIRSAVRFAAKDLLASGWLSGERVAAGKSALVEARYGQGRVVLFGLRPQFRGQPFGTFKLLLNAIYLGSARPL